MWINTHYVGVDVANEAAVAYYRLIDTVINNFQLQHLGDFLRHNHFHLGVKLANHLRRLVLNLRSSQIYMPVGRLKRCESESPAWQHRTAYQNT